jgi:hypothetical protein
LRYFDIGPDEQSGVIRAGESPRSKETPRNRNIFGWSIQLQDRAASYKIWITAISLETIQHLGMTPTHPALLFEFLGLKMHAAVNPDRNLMYENWSQLNIGIAVRVFRPWTRPIFRHKCQQSLRNRQDIYPTS